MNKDKIRIVNADYWKTFGEQLIQFLELPPNIKVLDVGTGGGACLIPAAKKILPNGEIIGIDKLEDAIQRAKTNIEAVGIKNARIIKMDGSQMKFANNTFDVVISGFIGFCGIFDFDKFELRPGTENSIIKEIYRVLKPGGKAAFSTWRVQEDLGIIKKIVEDDSVHPGYSKENEKGFKMLMEDAGFQNKHITIHTLEYHRFYNSIEDWATQNNWLIKGFALKPPPSYEQLFKPFFSEITGKYDFKKCVIFAIGKK